jgi:hypothetical protein
MDIRESLVGGRGSELGGFYDSRLRVISDVRPALGGAVNKEVLLFPKRTLTLPERLLTAEGGLSFTPLRRP